MDPITKEEWEALIAQWQKDNNTKKYPSAKQLAEIEADAITAGSGKTQDELDKAEKDAKIPKTKAGIDAWIATKTAPTELAGPLDVRPPRQIQSGSTRRSAPTVTYTGEFLVDEFGKPTANQLTDITSSNDSTVLFFQELQESGQAQAFIQDSTKNRISFNCLELSSIFKWFKSDFTKQGSLKQFVVKYTDTPIAPSAKVDFLEYNWELNGK